MNLPCSFGHSDGSVAQARNGEHPTAGGIGHDGNDQVSGLVSGRF
jgi:hypothetical protein